MVQEILSAISIALLRIVAALVLSAGTLYSGMRLLDGLTSGIDEWKEIKKGNVAIGILFASVMASLMLLVGPAIYALAAYLGLGGDAVSMLIVFLKMLLNFIIFQILGIVVIFLTLNLVDRITPDIDEFAELKKGNIAIAVVMASALLLVAYAASPLFKELLMQLIEVEF
ncbi:MAG: DUF350 domain-containing protein [Candidatus Micrarchaeota archaeon]